MAATQVLGEVLVKYLIKYLTCEVLEHFTKYFLHYRYQILDQVLGACTCTRECDTDIYYVIDISLSRKIISFSHSICQCFENQLIENKRYSLKLRLMKKSHC